ncbi:MAG: hypothetical protein ABI639_06415 [Thermoanaerobaculia bacterium]
MTGLGGWPAGGQILVTNPHFDTDVSGWQEVLGTLIWTDLTDEGDCSASGSAIVASEHEGGQEIAAMEQCAPIGGVANLFAQVRHMGYGNFTIELDFTTTENCSTGFLTTASTTVAQTPGVWQTTLVSGVPPPGTNRVLLRFFAVDTDPHGLSIDEAILGSRWPLLIDGFDRNDPEGGGGSAPCRWGVN